MAVVSTMIGVAGISIALAYVLYFRVAAMVGATNLGLVTFLIPVNAFLLGVLFLGEVLLHSMALIGFGLAAIDGRSWKAIRQPHRASTRQNMCM